jgi:hypothetical protein
MSCTEVIRARVTAETKREITAVAERAMLSESAWLKQLLVRELRALRDPEANPIVLRKADVGLRHGRRKGSPCDRPVLVLLRPEDRLLLDARAEARGMRPATYVSVLTRCHLRRLAPLPKEERLALRLSISELSAIGRNINQIARAANEGGRLPGSAREEFRAMLKICEALRDNTRSLLMANATSWESGFGADV